MSSPDLVMGIFAAIIAAWAVAFGCTLLVNLFTDTAA
jgi:hypothetical protein